MRILLSLLMLLTMLVSPALAGDADSPEITDDCGAALTAPDGKLPENDICAGWLDASFDGDDVLLDFSVRTAAPTMDDVRFVQASFTAGDCRYTVTLDDAVGSVGPTEIGQVGTLLPDEHPLAVGVACDPGAPCGAPYDGLPINCSTHAVRDVVPLGDEAVSISGDVVTFHLDLVEMLADSDVDGRVLEEGQALTGLKVVVATQANGMVSQITAPGLVTSGGESVVNQPNADVAYGEGYTIPLRDGAAE